MRFNNNMYAIVHYDVIYKLPGVKYIICTTIVIVKNILENIILLLVIRTNLEH